MPIHDDILAAASAAEAKVRQREAYERALDVRRCESAINAAHEALQANQDGLPDLDTLGRVLIAFDGFRPNVDDHTYRRMLRAAAHILASSSRSLDRHYIGERSQADMPRAMPKDRLPPIPTAADDDDL